MANDHRGCHLNRPIDGAAGARWVSSDRDGTRVRGGAAYRRHTCIVGLPDRSGWVPVHVRGPYLSSTPRDREQAGARADRGVGRSRSGTERSRASFRHGRRPAGPVGPADPIPPGEREPEIAIGLLRRSRVVDPMRVGGHDDPAEDPVRSQRKSKISMVEQGAGAEEGARTRGRRAAEPRAWRSPRTSGASKARSRWDGNRAPVVTSTSRSA